MPGRAGPGPEVVRAKGRTDEGLADVRTNSHPHRPDANPAGLAGAPAWLTPELIERTLEVWQPYSRLPLTREDALAMILAVSRLFNTS